MAIPADRIDEAKAEEARAHAVKDGHYVSGNLLFNPLGGGLNVGVEYLYGSKAQHDGAEANASRIQFAANTTFTASIRVGQLASKSALS